MSERRKWRMSRRGFLIGVGAAGASLAIGLPIARLRLAEWLEDGAGRPVDFDAPPMAWFEIQPDNR
ncbi:MAG TPA: twin-arginine translocation signal domain-containing protein, partial [Roseiflexaceae bacterium]|nr:twin-arginine translocation signal domain-containing protein [Roseiflexaceae bacterium]